MIKKFNNKILMRYTELVGRDRVKGEAYTTPGYIKTGPTAANIQPGSYQQFIYLIKGGGDKV